MEKTSPYYFSPERDEDSDEYGLYKELAMCMKEEPRKYSHILMVLKDLGWGKVYYDTVCYIVSPLMMKIAQENDLTIALRV